ncbi:MAG: hypothetical protein IJ789_02130 [Bacteroidales bacterium]|nr:hypothetical protein [Bacteroidales bacterium]
MALLTMVACTRSDDPEKPAFLHIDAINVVKPSSSAPSSEAGFYNSEIVAAYVVAYYPGRSTVDTIGGFRLPFTVPILFNGEAEYLEIYPAVRFSGNSTMLPRYPYYEPIIITNGLTFNELDTLHFDTLTTTYTQLLDPCQVYEFFEPTQGSIIFDSLVEWVSHDAEAACTGLGCGHVHIGADLSHLDFTMTKGVTNLDDPTKALFLELNYRGTKRLAVRMSSTKMAGASTSTEEIMVIYPTDEWRKLYINLGRVWRQFSYSPNFKIEFSVLNTDGTEGDIWLDNLKIVSVPF